MIIAGITLKNWRNFKGASVEIAHGVTYFVGPNASGKSNFLDSLRFIRDIAKPIGGGLQTALAERGGFSKVRSLHSRGIRTGGGTDLEIKIRLVDADNSWTYDLAVNFPKEGSRDFARVVHEIVEKNDRVVLNRPASQEKDDEEQMRVTYLEQAAQNGEFRELATFFAGMTYVHLVPQLVKFGERISGRMLPDDPFGQAFLKRIADTPKKVGIARLKKISLALSTFVPGLEALSLDRDSDGRPHIEMQYRNHRPHAARQTEDQMSDGTLRLIALLWLLQETRHAPLLLEEPELSLNEEIVRRLHAIFVRISGKSKYQLFITTHSYALLSNPGIPAENIFMIKPREGVGSIIESIPESAKIAIRNGVPPADLVLDRSPQLAFDI